MFAASDSLFAITPWTLADDNQILRLDIPALGVDGACLSIIVGALPPGDLAPVGLEKAGVASQTGRKTSWSEAGTIPSRRNTDVHLWLRQECFDRHLRSIERPVGDALRVGKKDDRVPRSGQRRDLLPRSSPAAAH